MPLQTFDSSEGEGEERWRAIDDRDLEIISIFSVVSLPRKGGGLGVRGAERRIQSIDSQVTTKNLSGPGNESEKQDRREVVFDQ